MVARRAGAKSRGSPAPGLRTGYLLAPDAAQFEALSRGVRATQYAPPAWGSLIATQWIEDGTADAIAEEARAEIAARRGLAAAILGDVLEMGAGARLISGRRCPTWRASDWRAVAYAPGWN